MFRHVQELQQNHSVDGQSPLLDEVDVHSEHWLRDKEDEGGKLVWVPQISQNDEKTKKWMDLICEE